MSRFSPAARAALGLTLGLWAFGVMAGDSMRCGSRLVSVEDRAAYILAVCGEPAYRDVWNYDGARGGGWIADTEEWTYNFGPNQLLRILKLRNGRLVDIQTQGYGFIVPAQPNCAPESIVEGLSKYRLVANCGEPLTRRATSVLRPLEQRGWDGSVRGYDSRYVTPVYREEWVYNFGARHHMRAVILENGRVADVESAGRGFDR